MTLISRLLILGAACALAACTMPTNSATPEKSSGEPVELLAERVFNDCPSPSREAAATLYSESDWKQERSLPELNTSREINWQVDFANQSVIRYTMGSKPTLGYSVRRDGPVYVRGNTVVLTVIETAPKAGTIAATALTTPCVYVQLAAKGLSKLKVVNVEGQTLAESP
jgi:hypothetical protein